MWNSPNNFCGNEKLLDLSLRNNFLNLRITRNALQVISADIDKMEDAFFRTEQNFRFWVSPLIGIIRCMTSGFMAL